MRAAAAALVFVLGVFLVSVTNADGPQLKVLGAGRGGATTQLVSTDAPLKLAVVPDVPVAVRSSVVADLPKLAVKGQSFALSSTVLRAPTQNGVTPGLTLLRPEMVSQTA